MKDERKILAGLKCPRCNMKGCIKTIRTKDPVMKKDNLGGTYVEQRRYHECKFCSALFWTINYNFDHFGDKDPGKPIWKACTFKPYDMDEAVDTTWSYLLGRRMTQEEHKLAMDDLNGMLGGIEEVTL